MNEANYKDLIMAIEHVSAGLEHLSNLALDLKLKIEQYESDQMRPTQSH
jgi:hypothetical protein